MSRRLVPVLTALLLVPIAVSLPTTSAHAAADIVVADWELNDPANATVMTDSGPNNLDGNIASDAASQGLTSNGSFYDWSARCPACLPVQIGRVVQVPDNDVLDIPDPSVTWTLEFRFRTTKPYGNYMQKGQSTSNGGQIKVQGPGGTVQCLFKGDDGTRVGTGSPTALDDGQWHTVQCIHTETQIKEFVDGVRVAVKNGSTGPINNKQPFELGGKRNCDQVTITCDYFSGDIDYVKVMVSSVSGNQPPVAKFISSCSGKSCTFDAAGSNDPDGTISSYAWDFGDTKTGTGVNPSHTYADPGDYTVVLTVTDNLGTPDSTNKTITVGAVPPGPPRNAAASAGDARATVTWDPPSTSDDPVTSYTVTSSPEGRTCTTAVLTCTVHGLTNGRTYTFTVVATSGAGDGVASAPSNAVRPAGSPSRTRHVTATRRPAGIRVAWAAAVGNGAKVKTYRVATSTGMLRIVPGKQHGYLFAHLKKGSHVRFRVRAVNRVGAGPWSRWTKRVIVR